MNVKLRLEPDREAQVSLTVTMSVGDLRALNEVLKGAAWPATDLRRATSDLLDQIDRTFWPQITKETGPSNVDGTGKSYA